MKKFLPLLVMLVLAGVFALAAPSISGGGGGGGITGSGAANQVAYFSSATALTSSGNLTFNSTTLTSNVGSGSDAFGVSVNGAHWHFGAGANDYASSDGTTVSFAGPVAVPSTGAAVFSSPGVFTINAASALIQFEANSGLYWPAVSTVSSGSILSNMSAATAGATPASALVKLFPIAALDATDWVFSVGNSNNATSLFHTDYSGNGTFAGTLKWQLNADNIDVGDATNNAAAQALPSCSAANSTLQYNTSTHLFTCSTTASVNTFSNYCAFASFTSDTPCLGGYLAKNGTEKTLNINSGTCQVSTAGSGGTTVEQIALVDFTGASTVATDTTSFACNTAASTPVTVNFGSNTLTAGHVYVIEEHTKGNCTVGALGLFCNLNLTP